MADKTVTYRLQADIAQFRAQMAQASAAVKQTATEMTALDKNGITARKGLTTLGSAAGKVGLVAAAGLGAAVLASAKFDSAMSSVAAATHESTQNMELLRAAALKAGADTVFSATEAAGAIEALAKAGVSTKDILGGGLQGALDLAAAGSMDVAAAAEAAATAMTQFGLQGQDVPHVADLLAAAAGRAQGEVSDFSMALNQSGLVAAQMGLSIEETTGSLAAFASAGLVGSDAGTSLKTMLLRLANPSKEAAAAMKEFGISAYDAQGNLLPMADIAEQIKTGFEGQSQATRDAALATIFGSDAIRAANVLYNEGAQGIDDWTNAVNDQGYAAETAATKLDNLKGDWEAFTGSLETALIGVGDKQQGFFRSIVQGATDVTNAFNSLPDAAKGVTASLLGITAVTGGGFWLGAKVITGISETRQALEQLGPAGTKAAGALRSVSIAAAGLLAINAASDAVNAMFRSMDAAAPSVDRLARNLDNLGNDKSKYTAESIRAIGEEVGSLGDLLDTTDSKFAGVLTQTTNWLGKIPAVGDLAVNQIENLDAVTTQSLQGWREADATIQALDQSLMQVSETAGPGGAYTVFVRLAQAQGLNADQQAKLMGLLPAFGDLMRDTGRAGEQAGGGTTFFADAIGQVMSVLPGIGAGVGGVKKAFQDATNAVLTFKGALEALNGLLDKRDAIRSYQQSIEDLGKTVKEFGPNSREAAQGFDDMARNIGVVASSMKGAARTEFLEEATRNLEQFGRDLKLPPRLMGPVVQSLYDAMAASDKATGAQKKLITQYHLTPKQVDTLIKQINMDASQAEIRDLLKQYGLTPKEVRTAIKALDQASGVIGSVRAQLAAIDGKVATTIIRTVHEVSNRIAGGFSPSADGSTVPKTGLPYADRHPYLLADGEEVISNRYGQADRHRQLLKAINAGRLADGGTVTLSTYARTRGASADEFGASTEAFRSHRRATDDDTRATKGHEAAQKYHEQRLKELTKAYDAQRETVDDARSALQQLRQDANAFGQSVSANFRGEDWYEADASIGFSSFDALQLTLKNQIVQARAFKEQLRDLRALGLSGAAFQYVAQSGDYGLASELASMNAQQVHQFEDLYQRRNRVTGNLGDFARDTAFGAKLDAATAEFRGARSELHDMKLTMRREEQIIKRLEKTGPERTGRAAGDAVGRRINSSAAAGRRRRNP